jgi:drug/metabolite transporter (DMT)-like permease
MTWVWLALGAALSLSLSDVLAKRALRTANPWLVAWVKFGGAAVLTAGFLVVSPWPLWWPFLGLLAVALPFEVLAIYLYHRAISMSPLSLTVPMLAFSPVFLIFVGWVLLGERTAPLGWLGVSLITLGAYILNLRPGLGILEPLRALWREPGARLMLAVAALYSVTASLGKMLVLLSSPTFFGAFYMLMVTLILSPIALRPGASGGLREIRPLVAIGIALLYGAMVIFHFQAIELAPVAYMIAVKRTSLLFAVLWGGIFFREEVTAYRAAGAVIMVAGVALLSAS